MGFDHIDSNGKTTSSRFADRSCRTTNDPYFTEKRGDVLVTRAMPMVSFVGTIRRCRCYQFHSTAGRGLSYRVDGGLVPIPIEYKVGRPKPSDCDVLQLCAQAMCLEETFDIVLQEGTYSMAELDGA